MKFANPDIFLYAGWTIPVLVLAFFWGGLKHGTSMSRFAEKGLIKKIAPSYRPGSYLIKTVLTIFAAGMILTALAGPEWGFIWAENRQKGLDIIFAIDTSNSMLTEDISPNRLERAKIEVNDFVRTLKGDRIGLIAFSGHAFMQCPLTADRNGFMIALNSLDEKTIPRGGTAIQEAIIEAVRGYDAAETDNRLLILITDGENTEGDLASAVKKAGKENIQISSIGIGSKDGEKIPITDEEGAESHMKDRDGNIIVSRLDEDMLKHIADETGGIYVYPSQAGFGLNDIYENASTELRKYEIRDKKIKVFEQRYQLFLGIAAILSIVTLLL